MTTGPTVAISGTTGFLGGRLLSRLRSDGARVIPIPRATTVEEMVPLLAKADVVAHLAGVTKSDDPEDFERGNHQLTRTLVAAMRESGSTAPILFSSTVRVGSDTLYGRTKEAAERVLTDYAAEAGVPVAIFRLPQFFGDGAKPHYNSIVATLLSDAAQGRSTEVREPGNELELVRVEDVVESLAAAVAFPPRTTGLVDVTPVYRTTVGEVSKIAVAFRSGQPAIKDGVDPMLVESLRATYTSYLGT